MTPRALILTSTVSLIILSLFCTFIGFSFSVLNLNENQILYLFSTSGQVLSGIYGLTLTGFIFFRNELSREEFDDETLVEVIEGLKKRYYKILVFVTCFTIFTLYLTNFIISYESKNSIFSIFLLNFGQSSFVINLAIISYFIFDVLEPKRIEKESQKIKEKTDPISDQSEKGSLEEFLRNYNQIETLIQKYGQAYQSKDNIFSISNQRRISNLRLAEFIFKAERIDLNFLNEIKNLIKLRNSIIHGADPIVSLSMVKKSEEILKKLSPILTGVSIE